jgi:hypothetical protein
MKKEVMMSAFLILLVSFVSSSSLRTESQCHPQCSWKCDDPHCPAICDPVCEPPKCHTSCAEPKNAICDVKCEKPECEIKCPDKGCELFDCPKCVTVCKAPHCVTHCQAPKPECEAVCEEPKCDWKCHKPNCPKPKCELVCENPNCVPKVECCNCQNGGGINPGFPFFKETETNKACCGCGNNNPSRGAPSENPQITNIPDAMLNTFPKSTVIDNGTHYLRVDKTADVKLFKDGRPLSNGRYGRTTGRDDEWEKQRGSLNLNLAYHDRH